MTEDRINVKRIRAFGNHGVYAEEQKIGQVFEVDLSLAVDLNPASESDNPADTIDYIEIQQLVRNIVSGPSHRLLESLAGTIADEILHTFHAQSVSLRLRKPGLRLDGGKAVIEVEFHKHRAER